MQIMLSGRTVQSEKQPLLCNDYITCNSVVTTGSGILYAVRADSYVMELWKNCWQSQDSRRSSSRELA
jgi:hypothetical protein